MINCLTLLDFQYDRSENGFEEEDPDEMKALIGQFLSPSHSPTPLFGNGAGAHGTGKISGVLTKIGKCDIVLMYNVSIARLIPIIKLDEKRERKKQV